MKHWHFMAKVYNGENMQLINISSGVINTPNTMSAADTMGYLSKMVQDQNNHLCAKVTISFDAFSLVESDEVEPSAPLTDEEIAQHRHDDKVDADTFAAVDLYKRWDATPPKLWAKGLECMSRDGVIDKLAMCAADPASNTQIIQPKLPTQTAKPKLNPGLQEELDGGWIISEMNGYYSPDEFELKYYVNMQSNEPSVLLRRPLKSEPEPSHVKVDAKVFSDPDCQCWSCAKPLNSKMLSETDFECPNCSAEQDRNLDPCVNCGRILTIPGGAHYCKASGAVVECQNCGMRVPESNRIHNCTGNLVTAMTDKRTNS